MSRRLGLNKSTTLTRAPTSRASFGRGSGHRDSFRATNASRGSTCFHFCSDPHSLVWGSKWYSHCVRPASFTYDVSAGNNKTTATKLVSDTTFASIVELRRGYSAEAEVAKQPQRCPSMFASCVATGQFSLVQQRPTSCLHLQSRPGRKAAHMLHNVQAVHSHQLTTP